MRAADRARHRLGALARARRARSSPSSPRRASTRASRRASRPPSAEADIVSCATLARAPLVFGRWLAPGSHLDLIGSFTPAMREADDDCFAGARVFVDSDDAPTKSGDLIGPLARGVVAPRRRSARSPSSRAATRSRPRGDGARSAPSSSRSAARSRTSPRRCSCTAPNRSLSPDMTRHDDPLPHDGRRRAPAAPPVLPRSSRRDAALSPRDALSLPATRSPLRAAITAAYRRPEPEAVPPLVAEARLPAPAAAAAQALARRLAQTLRDRRARPAAKGWSRACCRSTRCRRRKAWR